MDDLIEFILDLVLELGTEAANSPKTPQWIRYPLIALIGILYAALSLLLLAVGIRALAKQPAWALLLIALGLIMPIWLIRKLVLAYKPKAVDRIEF